MTPQPPPQPARCPECGVELKTRGEPCSWCRLNTGLTVEERWTKSRVSLWTAAFVAGAMLLFSLSVLWPVPEEPDAVGLATSFREGLFHLGIVAVVSALGRFAWDNIED